VGRIFVDFEASSLLRRAWTFRQIQIDRPVINAELDAKESLNLARLLKSAQTDAAPLSGPQLNPHNCRKCCYSTS